MDSEKFIDNVRAFYVKHSKIVHYVLIGLILALGAVYYYFEMYKKPREKEASESIYMAQKYFQQDSFDLALNGNGRNKGFLYLIKKFSGTQIANLSNYYVGIIYLNKGEFKKAVEYLQNFSPSSNLLKGYSKILLGDAKSELKEYTQAINLYIEGSKILADDDVMGAEALLKAGLLSENQNKNEEAIKLYKQLIMSFPASAQRVEAEKYIVRLGVTL